MKAATGDRPRGHVRRALALLGFCAIAGCAPEHGTIGALIAQDNDSGRLYVRDVPKGLAAARAGIEVGDEILFIDGLDVRALTARQIHGALSGDVDAPVKLTLLRGEQVVRVTVKRTAAQRSFAKGKKAESGEPSPSK